MNLYFNGTSSSIQSIRLIREIRKGGKKPNWGALKGGGQRARKPAKKGPRPRAEGMVEQTDTVAIHVSYDFKGKKTNR